MWKEFKQREEMDLNKIKFMIVLGLAAYVIHVYAKQGEQPR